MEGQTATVRKRHEHFEIELRLSPDRAVSRIVKATHGERRSRRGEQFMAGCLGGRIIVQKGCPSTRGTMGLALYARAEPWAFGCEIRGYFGMAPATQAFARYWVSAAIPVYIVAGAFIAPALLHGEVARHDLPLALAPFLAPLAGPLLLALGRCGWRRDPDDISEWLYDHFADLISVQSRYLLRSHRS